jgi:CBS-domain-containing membrane protein
VRLSELPLVDASVPEQATLIAAAEALVEADVAALAVLTPDRRVAGLFTDDDVLRGIFPRYVEELRHTAFVQDSERVVGARLRAAEPVVRHMREPLTVELEASALHVAERFLHCPWGALAVTHGGRFVGMLRQVDFVAGLLRML